MLLDDLTGVIESLRERIGTHGASLEENETRTRMALVDPLLQALGWDVSDPAVVTPEYRVTGGLADYALLRSAEQPAATVEAKKLGERLASHQMQMLNYANASGIDFAALTDGDHWELYDVFRRGTLEDRRILGVSISRDSVHEVALKLLLLWRPNLTSGQPVEASGPVVLESGESGQPELEEGSSAPEPPGPGWVALAHCDPPLGTQPPARIRFWDGSERRLHHWNEVLSTTVEKLHETGLLKVDDVPISSGKSTYLVSLEPRHPTGRPFGTQSSIKGTPLFVHTNFDARRIRGLAKNLLQRYGRKPDSVHLQMDQ